MFRLGIGFQFNFQSQVYIMLQSQYRMTLTSDIIPNNLYHSLGVIANVGKALCCLRLRNYLRPLYRLLQIVIMMVFRIAWTNALILQVLPVYKVARTKTAMVLPDIVDKCPDVAGLGKYNGCPIPDRMAMELMMKKINVRMFQALRVTRDALFLTRIKMELMMRKTNAQHEAGPASNQGCPVIDVVVVQKVNKAAENIFFRTGSSKLLAKSYSSLKNVAKILKDNPTYKIHIDGYTDNTGGEELNQKLSEARANSVKQYLLSNGIDESKITSTGHGESDPVASNDTAAGSAKNRRVEMKLTNY